jgi:hypothetical protein
LITPLIPSASRKCLQRHDHRTVTCTGSVHRQGRNCPGILTFTLRNAHVESPYGRLSTCQAGLSHRCQCHNRAGREAPPVISWRSGATIRALLDSYFAASAFTSGCGRAEVLPRTIARTPPDTYRHPSERVMHSGALTYCAHKARVIPAEAGIQEAPVRWTPACAGMTFQRHRHGPRTTFKMHNTH